jgi:GntR family transcriptional regulator, transcriptional repressor for pyruvate dehydrogenase complex
LTRSSVAELTALAPQIEADAFQPLRHATAYRSVFERIEQKILSGALRQGAALPSEQTLASQFEVNRSTVREAIRLLEQEGMLERRAGRRLFVSTPGIDELAPRATRALILHQVTFNELWQVAIALDPLATRLAAPVASAADIEELEANLAAHAALLKHADDQPMPFKRLAALDVAFHATVARISANRALILAREPLSLLYSPSMEHLQRTLPQASKRNIDAHRRIVAALRVKDAAQAEEWMRKHLVDFRRGFELSGLAMDASLTSARSTRQ